LRLDEYTEHDAPRLLKFLYAQFDAWPETARIYKGEVAAENDVTPRTEADVDALNLAGDEDVYYVVVYPGDPVTAIVLAVVAVLALAVVMYMLMPKMPGAGEQESANNSLGQRVNKARPNGRVPDIFGSVLAVPELLTVPLLTFENNREVEICFMCVGRGSYEISDVRDGETQLNMIAGAGAHFYGPNTRPGNGAPFYSVGTAITQPLLNVVKLNEVNGQILRAPDANAVNGKGNIRLVGPDVIETNGGVDFTEFFAEGDEITLTGASFGGSVAVFDATTQNARFYPDKRIEFETFDPTTLYSAGQLLVVSNAGFAGQNSAGAVVYVDVSGTYTITSVNAATRTIQLA